MSGAVSYHAGRSAEDQLAAECARRGHPRRNHRWRGAAGETDLIVEDGNGLIVVEVKKSRDFDHAAGSLSQPQRQRIYVLASEYLEQMPKGQLTSARARSGSSKTHSATQPRVFRH